MSVRPFGLRSAMAIAFLLAANCGASAQQAAWKVGKVSGEVWFSTGGLQKASLTSDAVVRAGDEIQTGRNGRVLLGPALVAFLGGAARAHAAEPSDPRQLKAFLAPYPSERMICWPVSTA